LIVVVTAVKTRKDRKVVIVILALWQRENVEV